MDLKKTNFLFMLMFSALCFSQIRFEKGYFIDNSAKKTECLIRNTDWRYNPTSFEYKLSENDEIKIGDIKNVQKFEILGQSKYTRFTVNIDQSNTSVNELSIVREPEFVEKQVFLKTIVEGAATLYSYAYTNATLFYIQKGDTNPEPLIYKKYETYSTKGGLGMAYNRDYQKQLLENLNCSSITAKETQQTEYQINPLRKIFENYNSCVDSNFTVAPKKGKSDFNLSIRPRVNFTSSEVNGPSSDYNFDFGSQTNFGIGLEAEFIMPFNKNKWAVIVEPTFRNSSTLESTVETSYNIPGRQLTASLTYKSFEIPVGFRHYMYLDKQSKLFLNAQIVFDAILESNFNMKLSNGQDYGAPLEMKSKPNFALGFGYTYNNKFTAEARYHSTREILSNMTLWSSPFNSFSLIVGYNIF